MIPGPIRDFVGHAEFHSGLVAGALLAGAGVAAGLVARERGRSVPAIGGLFVGIGFVLGVRQSPHLSNFIVLGLVLLASAGAGAGLLARLRPPLAFTGALLAIPGALVLAAHTQVPPVPTHTHAHWIAPLTVISIVVGAPLVADFDRRFHDRGWPMVLYAVSVVGVFYTVPDTERALVLLGVVIPLLFLGWPVVFSSLGNAGAYTAVGVLVWVSATEGRGRHTAIIGGVACLGLLVVEPLARAFRGGRTTLFDRMPASASMVVPTAAIHLALVFVASRVAGIRRGLGTSIAIVVIELALATAVLARLDRPYRERVSHADAPDP